MPVSMQPLILQIHLSKATPPAPVKKDDKQTGVMVAFFFPEAVQAKLKALPVEWPSGSESSEPAEYHVTLGFFGDIAELDSDKEQLIQAVKRCCSKARPALRGKISGLGRFSDVDKPGMDVIYASFDCPGLVEFRQELIECCSEGGFVAKTEHDFTAHITLAYVPSKSEILLSAIEPIEVQQSEVVVAWGGEHDATSISSLTKLTFQVSLAKAGWEESQHPREAKSGEFTAGGQGEASAEPKEDSYEAYWGGPHVSRVKGGTVLPQALTDKLRRSRLPFRFVYNTKSNNWHIGEKNMDALDHGAFTYKALDGEEPNYTEEIQARGVYDYHTNTITMYDFTGMADSIASGNQLGPLQEKHVAARVKEVERAARSHLFYIKQPNGRISKPLVEVVPMEEVLGDKKILRGSKHGVIGKIEEIAGKKIFRVSLAKEVWDPTKHPKDKLGQFAPKGTAGAAPKEHPYAEFEHGSVGYKLKPKDALQPAVEDIFAGKDWPPKEEVILNHLKPKKGVPDVYQGYAGGQTVKAYYSGHEGVWHWAVYNYGYHEFLPKGPGGTKEEVLQDADAYLANATLTFQPKKPVKVKQAATDQPQMGLQSLLQPHPSGGVYGELGEKKVSIWQHPLTGKYLLNTHDGNQWGQQQTFEYQWQAEEVGEAFLAGQNIDPAKPVLPIPPAVPKPAAAPKSKPAKAGGFGGHAPAAEELHEEIEDQGVRFNHLDDASYEQHFKIVGSGLHAQSDSKEGRWKFSLEVRGQIKHGIANTLSKLSGESYETCNLVVAQWMHTSNDADMRSLSLQEAVSQEFGVDTSNWQKKNLKQAKGEPLFPRETERKVMRAMYDNTQTYLTSLGYKPDDEVLVYRGVHTHVDAKIGDQINYNGNAMESWSLSANVANDAFGAGGMTLAMRVPVRSLISTCRTGSGCLNEGEVLVLGNAHSTATVVK